MDLLLIEPPYKSLKGVGAECGYTMSLTSLAAYLAQHGFDAGVVTGDTLLDLPASSPATLDMEAYASGQQQYREIVGDSKHAIWRRIGEVISAHQPKAVGISYLTPLGGTVRQTAAAIKAVAPDVPVFVGGHHATFCAEDTARLENIDLVVRGEGELPVLGLARALANGSRRWEDVQGLTWVDSRGELRSTTQRPLLEELDALPEPARDRVLHCDFSKYRTHYAISARGCPYSCSFCSDRELWCKSVRRRSVDRFVDELVRLEAEYQPQHVDIVDGTFTFDRKYLKAFCEQMIARGSKLRWRCTARYDNLTEELLALLREAGCAALYFGLESGSSRTLTRVKKGIGVEQVKRMAAMVSQSGIVAITAVLLGTPGETAEDLRDTMKLMREVHADVFDVNVYVPLPGTPLYAAMPPEARAAIERDAAGYKSLDNSFSDLPPDEFRPFQEEAYAIAAETLERFQARIAGPKR